MVVRIRPHRFIGDVRVPASKSHTIRQLLIASLADGVSEIWYPLDSLDARSCVSACRIFGAKITERRAVDQSCPNPADENGEKLIKWTVDGNAGFKKGSLLSVPAASAVNASGFPQVDVGNSGTTLYLALAIAALYDRPIEFTGDEQIQSRSAAPLLDALSGLGIKCRSKRGCAPITIQGPWTGGKVRLPCPTSQYLSALLIAAPLAPAGTVTEIEVPLLNERPYIEMTLSYLKEHSIPFECTPDYSHFLIKGGYSWKAFSALNRAALETSGHFPASSRTCGRVPGDFSSAAFPAAAAAITGGAVNLLGLNLKDTQGDKFFLEILKEFGCDVQNKERKDAELIEGVETVVTISGKNALKGGIFDLNETPDLLPVVAAVAAFAHGDTTLVNVGHARIKETDRIAVMAEELAKLGVKCTEREDGLIIHGYGGIKPPVAAGERPSVPVLNGHDDHRIVMALAVAALGGEAPVEITGAESAAVTYPGFFDMIEPLAKIG